MKFTTLFALLGSAAASSDVKTLQLKDQMRSLQNMVKTAQTHDASGMISAITDRKAELEYQLALNGSADKKSVARELTYLLDLVQNIEQNNFEGATKTLAHRKNKLFKYQMHLAEEEEAPEEEAPEEEAPEEETPEETEETEEAAPTQEELDAVATAAREAATAAREAADEAKAADEASEAAPEDEDLKNTADETDYDSLNEAATALETAADEAEAAAAPKKNTGAIIGGVAAAVILIGGVVYYKRKSNEDNEGGQKEDKKLFRNTFKGNVVKKVQKEALVPTFAVSAEENI